MKKVKVTLKSGKEIQVLEKEVEILRKAELLKDPKAAPVVKEEKEVGETKEHKLSGAKTKAPGKAPVNISSANFYPPGSLKKGKF